MTTVFTDHITVVYGLTNGAADFIARKYDRHQFGAFITEKIAAKEYESKIATPGFDFIEKLQDRDHKTHSFIFRAGQDRADLYSYSGNGFE